MTHNFLKKQSPPFVFRLPFVTFLNSSLVLKLQASTTPQYCLKGIFILHKPQNPGRVYSIYPLNPQEQRLSGEAWTGMFLKRAQSLFESGSVCANHALKLKCIKFTQLPICILFLATGKELGVTSPRTGVISVQTIPLRTNPSIPVNGLCHTLYHAPQIAGQVQETTADPSCQNTWKHVSTAEMKCASTSRYHSTPFVHQIALVKTASGSSQV